MPSTIIDSAIFGDIFSTAPMRQVWSDENRTARYLQVEAALAKVQTERVGSPILPVVSQITALCRDGLGQYCHWGATTQDITDTTTVLQIREALEIVDADLKALGDDLAALARKHRDTPMGAHDLVYDICRSAIKEERPLLDLLAENAEIAQHATREQLAAMCDPAAYLGQSGVMVDRVLARWGESAGR